MDKRLLLATKIAKIAGDRVRDKYFTKSVPFKVKNDHSLVTEADYEANKIIINAIKKSFPQDDIVSEESIQKKKGSSHIWYIDPIDGTSNFVMGLDLWGVSIGITRNGRPYAGAIYLPPQKLLFIAQMGKGSFLNGKRFRAKRRKEPQVICITRGRSKEARKRSMIAYKLLNKTSLTVRMLGSAVVELVLLAQGKTDFGIFMGQKPWGLPAGLLMAREAGVAIKKLDKKDSFDGDYLLATSRYMQKYAEKLLDI